MKQLVAVAFASLAACTTLGPMPATTGISAVPGGRPGAELSAGGAPSYLISEGTRADHQNGDMSSQLLGLFEPDRLLGTRGLIAGARYVGRGGDMTFEPLLGYRHRLAPRFALAAIAHATTMGADAKGASYSATRAGGELALDAELAAPLSWLAIHGQATVGAMYVSAKGTYCVDAAGLGVDCADANNTMVDTDLSGVFPAATATLSLDLARNASSYFHGTRIAVMGTAGEMPRLRDGVESGNQSYVTVGVTWTVGFGAPQ